MFVLGLILILVSAGALAAVLASGTDDTAALYGGSVSMPTLVVFLLVVVVLGALIAVFALPLAREGTALAHQLPGLIDDARAGRGPIGHLLVRTHALQYVQRNQGRVREFVSGLGTPALAFIRSAATGVAAVVTIFVLAFLMVLQGPKLVEGTVSLFPEDRAQFL